MAEGLAETPQEEACPQEEKDAPPPPSNIVTSRGESKPSSTCNQPRRVSKRKMESCGPPVKKYKSRDATGAVRDLKQGIRFSKLLIHGPVYAQRLESVHKSGELRMVQCGPGRVTRRPEKFGTVPKFTHVSRIPNPVPRVPNFILAPTDTSQSLTCMSLRQAARPHYAPNTV
ncbi:hypothetical protein WMY93_027586 [Mugilogobius chulae]|uniref:Uncharacterized protein n=1 Tax=Mugilogobius chulae TaxID=88201 RepID=A0AAW0N3K8_9GOBI